jgi:putative transposase
VDSGGKTSVKRQAELLELSRSNVYNQARRVSERDLRLMRRIDGLHLEAISFQRSFLLC